MKRGERQWSFNPDVDEFGTPVWHYLQKYSMELPIAHDGTYWPCERFGWEPGSPAQRCLYAAPWNTPSPHARVGYFVHQWATEGEGETQRVTYSFSIMTGQNSLSVLGWQSPVAGKVSLSFELDPSRAKDGEDNPVVLCLEHSRPNRELCRWDVKPKEGGRGQADPVDVLPGDRLWLVATCPPPHTQHGALVFRKLEIQLTEMAADKKK
jgi:hypothetical protein